jgi:predicted metal-dependent phosphoesterase TrpH
MNIIDLHTHTTASDGKNTPTQNVELARERGIRALAITDHDTVGGVKEALQAGRALGVEVIPGIEVSTLYHGQDIHVLGYFLQHEEPGLQVELEKLRQTRNLRNTLMVEKLNQLGYDITMEQVREKQKEKQGNVGRPHIAEVLMDKGIVSSLEEAFELYLGREGKAYVNPPRISPLEGVQLIQRFGGVPVLAHPGLYDMDELIPDLVAGGLKGLEVYHPDHTDEEVSRYRQIAEELKLIPTGGSDYHGLRNGVVFHGELGSQPVQYEIVERLKRVVRV